jgi:hypothetical protein
MVHNNFPVILEVTHEEDLGESIKSIKETYEIFQTTELDTDY